jgi:ring-1,2-phenylacetyl-CoA epoxidase subunit PaaB
MISIEKTSVDPRIQRLHFGQTEQFSKLDENEEWIPFEVFHQKRRGEQHIHAGTVHAPDPELALVFAKEQYGRRLKSASIWVVQSTNIYTLGYENEDMFETTPEKTYREASGYKVRERISQFKKSLKK